jgi:hypothetical protein
LALPRERRALKDILNDSMARTTLTEAAQRKLRAIPSSFAAASA